MKKKYKYAKVDFTSSSLPKTRRRQFFDILKFEWRKLLLIGLSITLFSVPLIAVHVVKGVVELSTYKAMLNNGSSKEDIAVILSFDKFLFSIGEIIGYLILSLSLAGSAQILKNLSYNKGVLFRIDFIEGIKKYHKSFLLNFLTFGAICCLLAFLSYLSLKTSSGLFNATINGLTIISYLFIPLILLLNISQTIYYHLSLSSIIANSFRLFFGMFLKLLPFIIAIISVFVFIPFISSIIVKIIIEVVLIVLLLPVLYLVFHLLLLSAFDEGINKKSYPEIYRLGLADIETK